MQKNPIEKCVVSNILMQEIFPATKYVWYVYSFTPNVSSVIYSNASNISRYYGSLSESLRISEPFS